MHINTVNMGLPIVYFKGSQMKCICVFTFAKVLV